MKLRPVYIGPECHVLCCSAKSTRPLWRWDTFITTNGLFAASYLPAAAAALINRVAPWGKDGLWDQRRSVPQPPTPYILASATHGEHVKHVKLVKHAIQRIDWGQLRERYSRTLAFRRSTNRDQLSLRHMTSAIPQRGASDYNPCQSGHSLLATLNIHCISCDRSLSAPCSQRGRRLKGFARVAFGAGAASILIQPRSGRDAPGQCDASWDVANQR